MNQPTLFLTLLDQYLTLFPAEQSTIARVRDLVQTHPDAFERSCAVGHITGSAWIVTADRQRCLLTHHRKLDRWLQLGGHVDGERQVHLAALREAQEESGMMEFSFVELGGQVLPFDIDIHGIPATATEPGHEHYDLRYLLIAAENQPLQISTESKDLRWFTWSKIEQVQPDDSMRRMARKAKQLLFER